MARCSYSIAGHGARLSTALSRANSTTDAAGGRDGRVTRPSRRPLFRSLDSFSVSHRTDGYYPKGELTFGLDGTLYGATAIRGTVSAGTGLPLTLRAPGLGAGATRP